MKTLTLLFLLCNVLCSFSQKMDSDYFEEGVKFFRDGNYEDASKNFQYIVDHYKQSAYFEDAVYNLGISQLNVKNYTDALRTFQFILQSNVTDDKYIGGDIMSNPFANYKHTSASIISEIFKKIENYDSALVYLSFSDTLYPLQSFCGNEWSEYSKDLRLNYAELYFKLGEQSKATAKLLTLVWNDESEDKEIIEKLHANLKNDSEVFKDFKIALKNMTLENKDENCICYITFSGTKIQIPNYFTSNTTCDKRKIQNAIKQSELYKMFEAL